MPGEAEARGDLAFGHGAALCEVGFFRMLHDERVEGLRIGQRPAHDAGARNRAQTVGEGERAGILQHAEFGELLALEAACQGSVGKHLDPPDFPRAPRDELDDIHVVDHRRGVGQGDDGSDPAGRRRQAAAVDGLLVLAAGLAELHAHIDKAGRGAGAFAVDDGRVLRGRTGGYLRADGGDPPVLDQDAAGRIQIGRRVEKPGIDQGGPLGHAASARFDCSLRVSRSRQAMRTATPISTCCWISER